MESDYGAIFETLFFTLFSKSIILNRPFLLSITEKRNLNVIYFNDIIHFEYPFYIKHFVIVFNQTSWNEFWLNVNMFIEILNAYVKKPDQIYL